MRRTTKPWQMRKPERLKLPKLLLKYVQVIPGAFQTHPPDAYGINGTVGEWQVPTQLGPMRLSYSDDYTNLYCRFENHEAAAKRLGRNPHSGKWNHMFGSGWTAAEAFESFKLQLDALLVPTPSISADYLDPSEIA